MKHYLPPNLLTAFGVVCLIGLNFIAYAQSPAVSWDKTFGGNKIEILNSVKQTVDGGFILGGYSVSGISGNKSEANKDSAITTFDYWIVKIDAFGNKSWDKTIGGRENDGLFSVRQTFDGAYIIGGYSQSGISGDKSENNKGTGGTYDYWVIKLDVSGNKIWDKTIGGNKNDMLSSLEQTTDGGYILGGDSNSSISGNKSEANKGSSSTNDYWIVKLDAAGNKVWDKTLGGSSEEQLTSLQQTADGGYILGGSSNSNISGDKTENNKGTGSTYDYWVVKLNAAGNKIWDKTLGGSSIDQLNSLQQTIGDGYILGGRSESGISGDKSEAKKGAIDYWVIKLDAAGNKTWDKTIGGSSSDILNSLQQTTDNGYILGGRSMSGVSGDKTEASKNNSGYYDYWVVKLNSGGTKLWDKTIGGNGTSELRSLQQTTDGSYILGGVSDSNIFGDKTENSKGATDYWIVKLGTDLSLGLPHETITYKKPIVYPNPVKVEQEITIHLPATLTEEGILSLYDMPGKLIMQQPLTTNRQEQQLSLKGLKAGMYQVKVVSNNQSNTIKLIVQ